jgi:hypothetical protein
MLRFHKNVFFPDNASSKLKDLCLALNSKDWSFSSHAIDSIKDEPINLHELLTEIKALKIYANGIFEFYLDNSSIVKICYRFNWKSKSIIICLNSSKTLISVWVNSIDDNHATLRKNLYAVA